MFENLTRVASAPVKSVTGLTKRCRRSRCAKVRYAVSWSSSGDIDPVDLIVRRRSRQLRHKSGQIGPIGGRHTSAFNNIPLMTQCP